MRHPVTVLQASNPVHLAPYPAAGLRGSEPEQATRQCVTQFVEGLPSMCQALAFDPQQCKYWAWEHTPVIPTPWRQEDQNFRIIHNYIEGSAEFPALTRCLTVFTTVPGYPTPSSEFCGHPHAHDTNIHAPIYIKKK